MKCPHCNKEIEPLFIASGEDYEKYLCSQINELSCASCTQTKASGDQGVDLVVTLNGGRKLAVQCKLYSQPVGNEAVQEVYAGKSFYNCDMAIVVTNSSFTKAAFELAEPLDVELLHHNELMSFIEKESGVIQKRIEKELFAAELFYKENGDDLAALEINVLRRGDDIESIRIDEVMKLLAVLDEKGRVLRYETMLIMIQVIKIHFKMLPICAENGAFGEALKKSAELQNQEHGYVPYGEAEEEDVNGYLNAWKGLEDLIKVVGKILDDVDGGMLKEAISIEGSSPTYRSSMCEVTAVDLRREIDFCEKEFGGHGIDYPRRLYGKSFLDKYNAQVEYERECLLFKKIKSLPLYELSLLKKIFSLPMGSLFVATCEAEKNVQKKFSDLGFVNCLSGGRCYFSDSLRRELDMLPFVKAALTE